MKKFGKWTAIAALSFLSGLTGHSGYALATPSMEKPSPASDIAAQFTIYLGGFLFATGNFEARLDGDQYRLKALLSTAGLPRAFYEAEFKLTSEGELAATEVRPRSYLSDSWDTHSARKVMLAYDGDRMPHLTATPPYEPGDLAGVMPYQQRGTQDPVSAVLVPVVASANPCDRSIPVFDGRRRYDLKLSYAKEVSMTPRGLGTPIKAVACNVRYVPVAPIERRKFTDMLRKNDSMTVWLAPFDQGRVYMPVRLQLRTPLGGAVLELTNVSERVAAQAAAAETAYRLPMPRP